MRILLVGPPMGSPGGVAPYLEGLARSLASRSVEVAYAGIGGTLQDFDRGLGTSWKSTPVAPNFVAFRLRNPKSLPIDTSQPVLDTLGPSTADWLKLVTDLRPDLVHVHSFSGWPGWSLCQVLDVPILYTCHEYIGLCQRGTLVNARDQLCSTFLSQSDCHWCVHPASAKRKWLVAKTQAWFGAGGLTAVRYTKHAVHQARAPMRTAQTSPEPLAFETDKAPQQGPNPWMVRQERNVEAMNRSVGVLCVSHSVSETLASAGVNPKLMSVEFIGSPGAEALTRTEPPPAGREIRLLFHAGFVNYKGGHVLLDALEQLPAGFRLNMIGSGAADYLQRLQEKADQRVSFGGPFDRSALNAALADCHAVVAPMTGPDTSPQTVLEALAAGRPVVGSRIGGIPDFVEHGVNGLLADPGNADSLATQLSRLSEPGLLGDLTAQAKLPRTVSQHTDALLARYSGIIGTG